jgi:hypothetical protein
MGVMTPAQWAHQAHTLNGALDPIPQGGVPFS